MKIIINEIPIFIYWNYTEFWNQYGNKEVAGLTVRCFVRKGVGKDQVAYKEIVRHIKNPNGYSNEDKAKCRKDTLETAVNLLFNGAANRENRRLIWNTYLKDMNNNINGTRKSAKNVIKMMKSFTEDQLDIVYNYYFNKISEVDAKIVEMHNKIFNETLEA